MYHFNKQRKTYPRTCKIMKIGREWIDIVIYFETKTAKAKLQLDDKTQELSVGTKLTAQMIYLTEYGTPPVKYAVSGEIEILEMDQGAVERVVAEAVASKIMRKLKMTKKTAKLTLPRLDVADAARRLTNDPHHPAKESEVLEIDGRQVTVFDIPSLSTRVAIYPYQGKTAHIRASYRVQDVPQPRPISAKAARFAAEAAGQIWDQCPHCDREPIYLPKLVCEKCW
ncbi:hypothetical protein DKP76_16565 [Falsochrobactrum shanghaiense]|uniref:Uncharacterized protein n=1 Tax=Falsochrobactrum shanghaiense TaxID=2201899 RepID=A0A316J5C9_9HYPH|nr:hypothetical protein [Falsochrobactrum shanghaiense]PWL16586.1 hypothetical protein DKP76_16565 [Falsochrobactrum shanghaiense]